MGYGLWHVSCGRSGYGPPHTTHTRTHSLRTLSHPPRYGPGISCGGRPSASPYAGGRWSLLVDFDVTRFQPPQVVFETNIFHPSVRQDRHDPSKMVFDVDGCPFTPCAPCASQWCERAPGTSSRGYRPHWRYPLARTLSPPCVVCRCSEPPVVGCRGATLGLARGGWCPTWRGRVGSL